MMVQKVLHHKDVNPLRGAAPASPSAIDPVAFAAIAPDPALQAAMLAAFSRQLPSLMTVLDDSGVRQKTWIDALHKLRGACAAIGATRLHDLAAEAEASCEPSADARAARRSALLAEIERLKRELPAT